MAAIDPTDDKVIDLVGTILSPWFKLFDTKMDAVHSKIDGILEADKERQRQMRRLGAHIRKVEDAQLVQSAVNIAQKHANEEQQTATEKQASRKRSRFELLFEFIGAAFTVVSAVGGIGRLLGLW